MKAVLVIVIALALALGSGCSVAFQDSVRSSSVYCSTSHVWYAGDIAVAGAGVFASTRAGEPGPILATAGVFAASAAYGIYKRHNCVHFRETAPPEVWAAAAEAERQRAEQEAADRQAREQAAQEALQAALAAGAQQVVDDAVAQQPEPDPGQPQPPQPQPNPVRGRPVQPTIIEHRTVVPPRGTLARSRAQCDAILPLPAVSKSDPFGNAQKMMQINRGSCYECVDPGRTFAMETPPAQGFIHSCQ